MLGLVATNPCNDNSMWEGRVHEMTDAIQPDKKVNVGNLTRLTHEEAETIILKDCEDTLHSLT
jgi:hypothetical protein